VSSPDVTLPPPVGGTVPRLRPMRFPDLERVLEIELASYSMPWSEATFRGLLRRRDADLVVAEAAGTIIGYTASWYVVDQSELGNVAVDAAWRGRGVGALLVENALRRAAERDIREVFLEVRPSNVTARSLYERLGFREVGRRSRYYSLPSEDALVMRRPLDGDYEWMDT
jgi:[ribosomal protein S18]-alanine N-acetyltransferase